MIPQNLIVRTKLTPPRQQKYILARARILARLLEAEAHRLTIMQAGTGYGKSTALTQLVDQNIPVIWYRFDSDDADPQRFLSHLIAAFSAQFSNLSQMPYALLEEWAVDRAQNGWRVVIDSLVSDIVSKNQNDFLIIFDDVHLVQEAGESIQILDRIIGRAPATMHAILSSRYPIPLPSLVRWRVKGELLEIDQNELAFTPDEIDTLFRQEYGYSLTLEQAGVLMNHIEGWPIALYLMWQHLQKDGGASLAKALWNLSGSSSDLFTYLAEEVLAQQPADVQAFLRITAVLRDLTSESCNFLRNAQDSDEHLQYLLESGLFVVSLSDEHLRYHHLFRDLLHNQLEQDRAPALHRRAAEYYEREGDSEEVIYHLLQAQAYNEAAAKLDKYGRHMVQIGRLDTLANWFGELPPDILAEHPPLLVYLGDISRLHSRFEDALQWYKQAAQFSRQLGNNPALGQALRGQARVYLDLVNPTEAEKLLQEALRISDGSDDRESRARLLELLAENLLNQGRADEAQDYQTRAKELRDRGHGSAEVPVRLLLRTGRLTEARQYLEKQAEQEIAAPVRRPRAHRETPLVQSLVYSFQGEPQMALETAVWGTNRGEELDSHFISSVGWSRQGHAYALGKTETSYADALACYEKAIGISQLIDVPRLKVEPYWGLSQIYGFRGELETAEKLTEEAIEILRADGDEWVEMGMRVTMGASYALAGEYESAVEWLNHALTGFRNCSDTFGETAARLWLCLVWAWQNDETRLERDIDDLLQRIQQHQYHYLLTKKTFYGPADPSVIIPLLIFAREKNQQSAIAEQILATLNLQGIQQHPGYQLRIQTLGDFQLWRGVEEVPPQAWKRKKARQLFLLLLTHPRQMLHRDQIAEMLWPDATPEGSVRDFKIAYSALCNVLEPDRKRNAPSAYIRRDGSRYGLNLDADLQFDVVDFEDLVATGDKVYGRSPEQAFTQYKQALQLYHGEYLQSFPYDTWCHEERERLRALYLRTAERVAKQYQSQENWEAVIELCENIIQQDDCWEVAYQLLMIAYQKQGNRTQAVRTYQRCVTALKNGLGIEVTAVTQQLHESLI